MLAIGSWPECIGWPPLREHHRSTASSIGAVQLTGLLPLTLSLALMGLLVTPVSANEPPVPTPLEPRPLGPAGTPADSGSGTPGARRPDIVVFYLDDFAPRPRSLWDDPERTPNLARFVNRGTRFTNAIVSTPLCGPREQAS